MKIRIKRETYSAGEKLKVGQEIELDDIEAAAIINRGKAYPVEEMPKAEPLSVKGAGSDLVVQVKKPAAKKKPSKKGKK